ncbi:MAG: TauD/TfdA family dioxygenase [Pseudomonadota bacterium]
MSDIIIEPFSDVAGAVARLREPGVDLPNLDIAPAQQALKDFGAVIFTDWQISLEQFEAFSNRFSDDYMDNTGSGSFRKNAEDGKDGTIQNVAYVYGVKKQRTFGLPLHADRAYVKTQPELIWFYCKRPADADGLTFIADGERIWESLSDHAREVFEARRLKYIRDYPDGHWQVAFHSDDPKDMKAYCDDNDLALHMREDGSVVTEYVKPAVVPSTRFRDRQAFVNSILIQHWQEEGLGRKNALVRMEDGEPIPADVLAEVKEVGAALTREIPWASGDFAMIDNTRMMHGRTSFEDHERDVYARMCRSVAW